LHKILFVSESVLRKYIFFTISESCFKIYEKEREEYKRNKKRGTGYSSYRPWCESISRLLYSDDDLSASLLVTLYFICDELNKMYGFGTVESMNYIYKFFRNGRWKNYMLLTRYNREYYGKSFF